MIVYSADRFVLLHFVGQIVVQCRVIRDKHAELGHLYRLSVLLKGVQFSGCVGQGVKWIVLFIILEDQGVGVRCE